jgi:hypothetical protein
MSGCGGDYRPRPPLCSVPLLGTPEEIEQVVKAAGLEDVFAGRLDSIYEPVRVSSSAAS